MVRFCSVLGKCVRERGRRCHSSSVVIARETGVVVSCHGDKGRRLCRGKQPLCVNLRRTVEDMTFAQMSRAQEVRKDEWLMWSRGEEVISSCANGLGGHSDAGVIGGVRHDDVSCMLEGDTRRARSPREVPNRMSGYEELERSWFSRCCGCEDGIARSHRCDVVTAWMMRVSNIKREFTTRRIVVGNAWRT